MPIGPLKCVLSTVFGGPAIPENFGQTAENLAVGGFIEAFKVLGASWAVVVRGTGLSPLTSGSRIIARII
jgi:hypothetical protein